MGLLSALFGSADDDEDDVQDEPYDDAYADWCDEHDGWAWLCTEAGLHGEYDPGW